MKQWDGKVNSESLPMLTSPSREGSSSRIGDCCKNAVYVKSGPDLRGTWVSSVH